MDFDTFMTLARRFAEIDWAVREQLDDILYGQDLADQNPDALRDIMEFFAAVAESGDDDVQQVAAGWETEIREYLD